MLKVRPEFRLEEDTSIYRSGKPRRIHGYSHEVITERKQRAVQQKTESSTKENHWVQKTEEKTILH